MKKRVVQVLSLLLIAALTLTLFACSKKDGPADTTEESTSTIEATEEVTAETQATAEETTEMKPSKAEEPLVPSTVEEIAALYNSAVQKNTALQAISNSRVLEKGQIMGSGALEGKSYELTEDENAKKLIEKNESNQPMTLNTISAGNVAAASCKEQDGKYAVIINLTAYQGSQPTGETGYAGLIDYDECAALTKDIAALFNLKVKVEGADIILNEGVIKAEIEKESGKLLNAVISYKQSMDVKLKYSIINVGANIICQNNISLAA